MGISLHPEFRQPMVPLTQDVQRRRPHGEHILICRGRTFRKMPARQGPFRFMLHSP